MHSSCFLSLLISISFSFINSSHYAFLIMLLLLLLRQPNYLLYKYSLPSLLLLLHACMQISHAQFRRRDTDKKEMERWLRDQISHKKTPIMPRHATISYQTKLLFTPPTKKNFVNQSTITPHPDRSAQM